MRRESKKYLFDVQQACERLTKYISEKTYTDYEADDYFRSAVERQFEIIGEAIGQLHKVDTGTAEKIPDYQKIIAFRNILIHGYATIANDIVWGVIESDLSPLTKAVTTLLSSDT